MSPSILRFQRVLPVLLSVLTISSPIAATRSLLEQQHARPLVRLHARDAPLADIAVRRGGVGGDWSAAPEPVHRVERFGLLGVGGFLLDFLVEILRFQIIACWIDKTSASFNRTLGQVRDKVRRFGKLFVLQGGAKTR
jgi:hypothetical protein